MDSFLSYFKNNKIGQALVEYMLIFSLFALIAIGMVNAFNNLMGKFTTTFSVVLSHHLQVGVCEKNCFFDGYGN